LLSECQYVREMKSQGKKLTRERVYLQKKGTDEKKPYKKTPRRLSRRRSVPIGAQAKKGNHLPGREIREGKFVGSRKKNSAQGLLLKKKRSEDQP